MQSDAIKYPLSGGSSIPHQKESDKVPEKYLQQARKLIASELDVVNQAAKLPTADEYTKMYDDTSSSLIYIPSSRTYKLESAVSKAEVWTARKCFSECFGVCMISKMKSGR